MPFLEDERHELKERVPRDLAKKVVAFLNASGGEVALGVNDQGGIVGLSDPDEATQKVTNIIRDSIEPDATGFVGYELRALDGKDVLLVTIQEGTEKPYYLASKGMCPLGVYIRQGTSAAPASRTAIRRMIRETDGYGYEELRSLEQGLTFDKAHEVFTRQNIALDVAQMRSLGIIGTDGLYTNLGLLLSDQCPHIIKAAQLSGTPDDFAFQNRAEFSGSILSQLEDAYEFLDVRNNLRSTFSGLVRTDTRDYPEAALREALLNAVVHRDYAMATAPLLIKVYESEVEIVNMGGLMTGVTLEDATHGVSSQRNPHLADVFYRLRLIEAFGTGIPKIVGSYRHDEMSPSFSCGPNSFKVTLPNRNPDLLETVRVQGRAAHDGQGVLLRSRTAEGRPSAENTAAARACRQEKRAAKSTVETYLVSFGTEDAGRVIAQVQDRGSITRKEVEELLGVGQTTAGKVLRELVDSGQLQQEGRGPKTRYGLAG